MIGKNPELLQNLTKGTKLSSQKLLGVNTIAKAMRMKDFDDILQHLILLDKTLKPSELNIESIDKGIIFAEICSFISNPCFNWFTFSYRWFKNSCNC